ncbi:MAG: hypothetical protein HXY50_08605 [Ignavibacteriaceae bacterium]|nr:hypothetical protein [Ignavibacteriaceae bacterium]
MKYSLMILTCIFIFLAANSDYSLVQAQNIYFCEEVDEDGYPENESTSFTIGTEGGWLKILVRLDDEVDCNEIKYVIYKVSRNGKEKYDNTIYQKVEDNWVWFWKQVTFYDQGKYNVYVYDSYDNFLTSGSVRISYNN